MRTNESTTDRIVRLVLEAHLRTCPTCPPLYASLVGVTAALGELQDPDSVVPPALAERIDARADPGLVGPPIA